MANMIIFKKIPFTKNRRVPNVLTLQILQLLQQHSMPTARSQTIATSSNDTSYLSFSLKETYKTWNTQLQQLKKNKPFTGFGENDDRFHYIGTVAYFFKRATQFFKSLHCQVIEHSTCKHHSECHEHPCLFFLQNFSENMELRAPCTW